MTDHASWGWFQPGTWPGFDINDANNLDAIGNGLAVDPSGYVEITLRDADNDGIIYDSDPFDGSNTAPGDAVIGPTQTLVPREVALYTNCTMVANGVTYTGLRIEVTLFSDGSWGARLMDSSIPEGLSHTSVSSVTLGTWDGVEYGGVLLTAVDSPFVCFCAETPLRTPAGYVEAGTLRPGARVMTRDDGSQPVIWVGRNGRPGWGRAAPVVFPAGIFGLDGPVRLSPQHRVLLRAAPAELLFGVAEVFVRARDLVGHFGIRRVPVQAVSYVHVLLPRHGVLDAAGMACESYHPGRWSMARASGTDRAAIRQALAGYGTSPERYGPTARRCLTGAEARVLLSRMQAEAAGLPRLAPPAPREPQRAGLPRESIVQTCGVRPSSTWR